MAESREWNFTGSREEITTRVWPGDRPRYVALLVHGYGEHIGRYEHVADTLVGHGAAVYGPDHIGHGRSGGERVLVEDFEDVVTDVHTVAAGARADHPDLPTVLIGHSMGGLIAARYAQRYGAELAALVLSGPVIGRWDTLDALRAAPEIPDVPIDPAALSRDLSVGEAYAADPLVWHGPFKRPTLDALAAALDAIAAGGDFGALPTLWVHGTEDQVVPLDGSRGGVERVRGGDFTEVMVAGARHEVFNETDKDETLARVTAFIDRALGARRG